MQFPFALKILQYWEHTKFELKIISNLIDWLIVIWVMSNMSNISLLCIRIYFPTMTSWLYSHYPLHNISLIINELWFYIWCWFYVNLCVSLSWGLLFQFSYQSQIWLIPSHMNQHSTSQRLFRGKHTHLWTLHTSLLSVSASTGGQVFSAVTVQSFSLDMSLWLRRHIQLVVNVPFCICHWASPH